MAAGAHVASMVDGPQVRCQPAGQLSAEIGLRVLTLEQAGLIGRKPNPARSLAVLLDPDELRSLASGYGQTVKSTMQRYSPSPRMGSCGKLARAGLPARADFAYSNPLMTKVQPTTRHIISINDLSNKEIETIFEVVQGFLAELADPEVSYRIGRGTDLASRFILASRAIDRRSASSIHSRPVMVTPR